MLLEILLKTDHKMIGRTNILEAEGAERIESWAGRVEGGLEVLFEDGSDDGLAHVSGWKGDGLKFGGELVAAGDKDPILGDLVALREGPLDGEHLS